MNMSAAGLIRWSCAVLSVIGLLYAIAIGLHFRGENRTLLDEGLQPAQRLADEVQAQIEGTLRRVAETIDAAAENLWKAGTPDEPDLLAAIRDMMYADPGFVEAGPAAQWKSPFVNTQFFRESRLVSSPQSHACVPLGLMPSRPRQTTDLNLDRHLVGSACSQVK